ncbi:MAG: ATP-binding protein [Chloroflexi bacterium]|nr:ATP-binding protein [Chloroflexota bacterium]
MQLIMLAGLPGTGKSTIARELARAIPAVVLDKDRIRAALFPAERMTYTTAQDDFCLDVMLRTATELLRQKPEEPVILDGRTFSRSYQVHLVKQHAAQLGASLLIIECVCSDATARERLSRDAAAGDHPAANRNYELYLAIKERFEPIREPRLVVNTDQPFPLVVAQCLAATRLAGSAPHSG